MMLHPDDPAIGRHSDRSRDDREDGAHAAECCEALAQVYEGCCGAGPMSDTLAILQALDPRALDTPAHPGRLSRLLTYLRRRGLPA